MTNNKCPQCGASRDPSAEKCKYCDEKFTISMPRVTAQDNPTPQFVQQMYQPHQFQTSLQQDQMSGIQSNWPIKNKTVAGLLGIFFGGIGIHKFYLGKPASGILYLVFCWTYIPTIIGFIEGVVYLASNDHNFQIKHKVRLKD